MSKKRSIKTINQKKVAVLSNNNLKVKQKKGAISTLFFALK